MRAALHPEGTRMMFFVAKDDGSHAHYFSETYAEHNGFIIIAAGNRARYRAMLALRADSAASAAEAAAAEGMVSDNTGTEAPIVQENQMVNKDPKIRETKPRDAVEPKLEPKLEPKVETKAEPTKIR